MRLSSLERYREFVERQNIPENYEVISGAPLMYIGEKNAKHLIIMLHGEYSSLE
jgi:hypothetical protein